MGLVRPDCPGDTSCEEALSFNRKRVAALPGQPVVGTRLMLAVYRAGRQCEEDGLIRIAVARMVQVNKKCRCRNSVSELWKTMGRPRSNIIYMVC